LIPRISELLGKAKKPLPVADDVLTWLDGPAVNEMPVKLPEIDRLIFWRFGRTVSCSSSSAARFRGAFGTLGRFASGLVAFLASPPLLLLGLLFIVFDLFPKTTRPDLFFEFVEVDVEG
jgi:hypothetical protein